VEEYSGLANSGLTHHIHSGFIGEARYRCQANVTLYSDRATLKWRRFVTASILVPTTSDADCTQCDPQSSPVPAGTVGLFKGAHYYHCGAFRAEFNCKMRVLGKPFCAVCRERILTVLTPHLDGIVPHVQEMRQPQATQAVYKVGLVPRFIGLRGPWSRVYGKSLGGGTTVPYGSTVTLRLTDRPMP
jgi:hypothetical protein